MATLRKEGDVAHQKYAEEINKLNSGDTYRPENFLKEVQTYMEYQP